VSEYLLIPDADLDDETRTVYAAFITARCALDGSLVWPVDELGGFEAPDPEPADTDIGADRIAAEVARRQAARSQWSTTARHRPSHQPSRWAHVPLAELFREAGNPIHVRANGVIETGHEPIHGSQSGRCVEIDSLKGLWWCRGCRQGGDAITLVKQLRGCSAQEAARELTARFGPPAGARSPKRVITVIVL
jgi:hypothetical protein